MRYLAPHLPGIDIAPTNLPGDAGRAMLAALGDAPPNGMTIGWVITPTLPARMIDRGEPSLGKRIRLLGQVEREPIAFVSPASEPANSIQDIIQRASDDADAVPLGTPPAGSPPHLAALRLQVLAQTQLNIVTFPSSEAARQAVLDGNVSAAALGLSAAIGDLRDGHLTALGIAARRRFGPLPDTPVLDEGGIPLSAFITRGIGVPVGTPPDAVSVAGRCHSRGGPGRSLSASRQRRAGTTRPGRRAQTGWRRCEPNKRCSRSSGRPIPGCRRRAGNVPRASRHRGIRNDEAQADGTIPFLGPQVPGQMQRHPVGPRQQRIRQRTLLRPKHHRLQARPATLALHERSDRVCLPPHPVRPHHPSPMQHQNRFLVTGPERGKPFQMARNFEPLRRKPPACPQ